MGFGNRLRQGMRLRKGGTRVRRLVAREKCFDQIAIVILGVGIFRGLYAQELDGGLLGGRSGFRSILVLHCVCWGRQNLHSDLAELIKY